MCWRWGWKTGDLRSHPEEGIATSILEGIKVKWDLIEETANIKNEYLDSSLSNIRH